MWHQVRTWFGLVWLVSFMLFGFAVLGIKLRALLMPGKHSTIEQYPSPVYLRIYPSTGKMVQQLRMLAIKADQGLFPKIHMMAHNCL